jgi:excinuclease UvrABC nuclease subunit
MSSGPSKPGVYAIYLDGVLSYIGSSKDIRHRLSTYAFEWDYGGDLTTPWGVFRTLDVKVFICSKYGSWLMREARLIRRLRPRFNTHGTGRKNRPYRRAVTP